MGLFYSSSTTKTAFSRFGGFSLDTIHKQQCAVCPLHKCAGALRHPKMLANGAREPEVYLLGEAPGKDEDIKGRPFVGMSGKALHLRIPDAYKPYVRSNNIIRCRPPNNRDPDPIEIEACRPSIVDDINRTKPPAVFGFGAQPLHWLLDRPGVNKKFLRSTLWAGRRVPVQIGEHVCWYYPMMHPSYVVRSRRKIWDRELRMYMPITPQSPDEYGSEIEFAFAVHMKRALHEVFETDLPQPIIHTREQALEGIEIVTGHKHREDLNRVTAFLREAAKYKLNGNDLETEGTRPYQANARILSAAVAYNGSSLGFAIDHPQAGWTEDERDELLETYAEYLRLDECRKVVHALGFELEWYAYNFGRDVIDYGSWGDSISQAWTLDERRGAHSLDFLCLQHFGINLKSISNLDRSHLERAPLDKVLRYNALDSKYHRNLYVHQTKLIVEQGLQRAYKSMLERVAPMVLTQIKGVPIHQETVKKFYRSYSKQLAKIEGEIAELPIAAKFRERKRATFRPSATRDLRYVLESIYHIDLKAAKEAREDKIKGGEMTDASLQPFASKYPLVKLVLAWRKANKNLSTYVLPLVSDRTAKELSNELEGSPHIYPDGKIHPTLKTTDTDTSRTSSDKPNAQNFPKRKTREVRSQIRGDVTEQVVSFDFSGIQARNVAMESNDVVLVDAFWNRYNIHADWRDRILRIYPQWIPGGAKALASDSKLADDYRSIAKNGLVFPRFFGAFPKKIAGILGVPINIAERLVEEFDDEFRGVNDWQNGLELFYREHGYVTGHTKIRRRAPISFNQMINAPIQQDEAAIVTAAMEGLVETRVEEVIANLEVHDALEFIWKKKDIERHTEIVVREMLKIRFEWLNVPLEVERHIGDDWATQAKAGTYASDRLFGHTRTRANGHDRNGTAQNLSAHRVR